MESKFNEDQLEELRESFAIYDQDGDGKITYRELGNVMRSLGFTPTEAEIIDFMTKIDTDHDGVMNFEEFANTMAGRMKTLDSEEDIIAAFRVFDVEGKGFITEAELSHVMLNLGEKLTPEELKLMMREADHDSDGVINYADFVRIMTGKMK